LRALYREAVAFDTGLIASGVAKINTKTGLLRNGRSACTSAGAPIGKDGYYSEEIAIAADSAARSSSSIAAASRSMNIGAD
jgi:hypothetical protein